MSNATTSTASKDQWLADLAHLGVRAERMSPTGFRRISVAGLQGLTELHRAPVLERQLPSPIQPGTDPRKVPDDVLVEAIRRHAMGLTVIEDPALRQEIDRRFDDFVFDVHAAEDIDVTRDRPLIINNNSIAAYNEVRIHPGGYIQITAPCNFRCQVLKKMGPEGSDAAAAYDIRVAGENGKDAKVDDDYWKAKNGADGEPWKERARDAHQDCAHGQPGENGQSGRDGLPGRVGDGGGRGRPAPEVVFRIGYLAHSVTALNQGGEGGRGGPGGRGGNGGAGQDGGRDAACGLYWQKGGAGGNGGNGADGADGGPGGDAGDGAKVVFHVQKQAGGAQVIAHDGEAPGGVGGEGGQVGRGGDAGVPGKHGASGRRGTNGKVQGKKGADGSRGRKGQTLINPPTV